jgi:GT2 family glycosyltransferase
MISIIICSKDDRKFRAVERVYQRVLPRIEYEIIRMKEVSSLTSGYNQGFRQAKYDKLIFCHDDIFILDRDFSGKLLRRLDEYDILGIAGTDRLCDGVWTQSGPTHIFGHVIHVDSNKQQFQIQMFNTIDRVFSGMQAMDGVFLATHRRVVDQIPFDEETFDGFHMYDLDFTFRAYLAGFRLAVCSDISVLHYSRGVFDKAYRQYRDRFNDKHRGSLAPKIVESYGTVFHRVDHLHKAKVFLENPFWEPWP